MFEPERLIEQALPVPVTRASTRMELLMFVSTQVLKPEEQTGIGPVPSPGDNTFVSVRLTGPQGSRSGPPPNSLTTKPLRIAGPVFVTVTYQVILLAMTPHGGVEVWTGMPPLTETSF